MPLPPILLSRISSRVDSVAGPDVFPVDHFALTGLNHLAVLIHRYEEGRFHLYVTRSFALATWEWMIDAALPCGYDIESGPVSCHFGTSRPQLSAGRRPDFG